MPRRRTHCAAGHELQPDAPHDAAGRAVCLQCRAAEQTGPVAALAVAMDAYHAAPPAHRDDMFVRELLNEMLREVTEPTCSFTVTERCGALASMFEGRGLCAKHRAAVPPSQRVTRARSAAAP